MKINHYEKDGIDVIEVKGKILGGEDFMALDDKLYSLLGRGRKKAVLDLGECEWISSTGLGRLIHHSKTFQETKGELKLARLTAKVKEIITITRLLEVFDVTDTVEEAIQQLKQS